MYANKKIASLEKEKKYAYWKYFTCRDLLVSLLFNGETNETDKKRLTDTVTKFIMEDKLRSILKKSSVYCGNCAVCLCSKVSDIKSAIEYIKIDDNCRLVCVECQRDATWNVKKDAVSPLARIPEDEFEMKFETKSIFQKAEVKLGEKVVTILSAPDSLR